MGPPRGRVRDFLGWFGAERRGYRIVRNMRRALEKAGLQTIPDFEYAYIDRHVSFVSADDNSPIEDPTYSIGALASAN